ncbi:SDR family NAD(P)-dependent oxidoreductase [Alteromonas macleodii]|uniref:SDR family NAD(P)-dependent oxidoreductase n=1 Tax=Alteromonas macleodii TaxID=28108 RepID=UPI00057DC25B|nr:SDR family oxidoreductase [Alteromonas macleodii]KHT54533.1 short-chain dehydrogenase [Alteromonas macleodii]
MPTNKPWAFITGAAGGIGKALVDAFVNSGYRVIAADIKWESKARSKDVYELSLNLEGLAFNSKELESLRANIMELTEGKGLNALVNNAAVQITSATENISSEDWAKTWDVNFHAPFFLIQTFLDTLTENNGSVVNISSIHATQTKRDFVAYASSKGALSSLTRNLAVDLRDKIRVNAIEPAAVATDMLVDGFSKTPEKYEQLNRYHPLGRISEPQEVAELAVYLCSDNCRFIQGACIPVSGGIHSCLSDPSFE